MRGRIQATVSPASSNSSLRWSAPKHRVIVPSGQGTSTTSALGRSVSSAQCRCSASRAMPRTRESTEARTCPAGRRTRATSAIRVSAARCLDRVRSSAMTPSAQPSARNDRLPGSEASQTTWPGFRPRAGAARSPSPAEPVVQVGRDGRGLRDAQDGMAGRGGDVGGARPWPGDVDEQMTPVRQP